MRRRQREGRKAPVGQRGHGELGSCEGVAVALVQDRAPFERAVGHAAPKPPERAGDQRAGDQRADVDGRQRSVADGQMRQPGYLAVQARPEKAPVSTGDRPALR